MTPEEAREAAVRLILHWIAEITAFTRTFRTIDKGLGLGDKVVYKSNKRDPSGYGMRLFQVGSILSRKWPTEETREVDSSASRERSTEEMREVDSSASRERSTEEMREVLYILKKKLLAAQSRIPDDIMAWDPQEASKALAELYSSLHYERPVRAWAAELRAAPQPAKFQTPLLVRCWYWTCPVLLLLLCLSAQSFMLSITTEQYLSFIHYESGLVAEAKRARQALWDEERKRRQEELNKVNEEGSDLIKTLRDENYTDALSKDDILGRMAEDYQLYDVFGDKKWAICGVFPRWFFAASGMIPAMAFVATAWCGPDYAGSNVGLWTKTLLIAAAMALLRGACNLLTILPDSRGWADCAERLGPAAWEARHFDARRAASDALRGALGVLWREVTSGEKNRESLCADMLVSGHTYLALLFSLATYEHVRYITEVGNPIRVVARYILCTCVIIEVTCMICGKKHYTVDLIFSFLFVLLLWDSRCVEMLARYLTTGYHWRDRRWWCFRRRRRGPQRGEVLLFKLPHTEDWKEAVVRALWDKGVFSDEYILIRSAAGVNLPFKDLNAKMHRSEGIDPAPARPSMRLDFLREPKAKEFPIQVVQLHMVEPWQSLKLIDHAFLHHEVLEDPDCRIPRNSPWSRASVLGPPAGSQEREEGGPHLVNRGGRNPTVSSA